MSFWLAVTRDDVADYVETLALVYLVLIFIRIILSWIPRMPYNRYLGAFLKFVDRRHRPIPQPLPPHPSAACGSAPALSTSARSSPPSC